MGDIRTGANDTYRDYVTDGLPVSGPHEPAKADIRGLFATVEDRIDQVAEGGALVFKDTKTLLDADLVHAAGTYALVQFDSTDAQNGYYKKSGSSGSGSWTFLGADPRVAAKTAAESAADDAEGFKDAAEAAAATASAAASPSAVLPAVVTAFYPCDEGDGVILRDVFGGADIDLTGKTGAAWTPEGVLSLTSEFFLTPSLTATTMFMVLRSAINANAGYVMAFPAGSAVGQSTSGGTFWTSCRSLSGQGVHTLQARGDASGSGAYELNAGGWVAPMVTKASETGTFIIGAANTGGAGPADYFEVAGFGFATANPSAAEASQIRNYLRRILKPRSIYIAPRDCPTWAELTVIAGESTASGTIARSALSPTEKLTFSENTFIAAKNSGAGAFDIRMARLWFSDAAHNCSYAPGGDLLGMEWGFVQAQNLRADYGLPCHVLKVGIGSTYSFPPGNYTDATGAPVTIAPSQTRYPDEGGPTTGQSLHYTAEDTAYHRAEQGARNAGIGYVVVTVIEFDGLNNAYIGTGAITSSADAQAWAQARYDARKASWGIANLKQIQVYPHPPQGGVGGGDADYPAGAVGTDRNTAITRERAGEAAFVAANASDVQGLDSNDFTRYPLNNSSPNNDWVHWSLLGYKNIGIDAHALIPFSVAVVGT